MKFPFALLAHFSLVTAAQKSLIVRFAASPLGPLLCRRSLSVSPPLCTPLPVNWGQSAKKTKKKAPKKLFQLDPTMADPKIEEILAPLRATVREQVVHFHWSHFSLLFAH